jgi:hypothetical protein
MDPINLGALLPTSLFSIALRHPGFMCFKVARIFGKRQTHKLLFVKILIYCPKSWLAGDEPGSRRQSASTLTEGVELMHIDGEDDTYAGSSTHILKVSMNSHPN